MNKLISFHGLKYRKPFFHSKRCKSISTVYNTNEVEQNASAYDRNNEKLFPNVERVSGDTRKFNTILPPPNVTGQLHLGHAMMITVLDVLCRWKQLKGYTVKLVPGLDHAGIATQAVVEQQLKTESGLTRFDIGKEEFIEMVLKWKDKKGNKIKEDILKMGTIFNWENEYFTMDTRQSFAVAEAFVQLFDAGLIYRKEALVNWSCALRSTISDIEIETIEINGPTKIPVPGYQTDIQFGEIYHILYRTSNANEHITVATTRPETLLGDSAIAVNPHDERYTHLLNENARCWHPFRNEWIPLIADKNVNTDFGTGAVKITPAHSKSDYEIACRHKLPLITVINENGLISNEFHAFAGLPRFSARDAILNALADRNLFVSKMSHHLELPLCSRSKDVIEFISKPQWFLNCDKMSTDAMRAIQTKQIRIEPSKFENEWTRWHENTIDWCLSRQIWWGHQIPAYHCSMGNKSIWIAAHTEQEAIAKALVKFGGGTDTDVTIKQDEDVLDTWFSSGILPFSLFGWPHIAVDSTNYPLDVLVSGHDILLFWIARMVALSTHFQGTEPFRRVFLHGIVCDEQGRKMSKSRGNVITPDQVINGATLQELRDDLKKLHKEGILSQKDLVQSLHAKERSYPCGIPHCGVDALRFTLCYTNVCEHKINFNANHCENMHRFLNKVWNAMKFTLSNCTSFSVDASTVPQIQPNHLSVMDKWILSRLSKTIIQTSNSLDALNVGCASLWHLFFYENFCDVYLEAAKYNFQNRLEMEARIQCEVLKVCLTMGLRYMGIYTPFLSNELLGYLPHQMEFLPNKWIDDATENDVAQVLEVCSEIRKMKRVQNILKKHGPRSYLFTTDSNLQRILNGCRHSIDVLTFSLETCIVPSEMSTFPEREKLILTSIVNNKCSVGISTDIPVQLIDIQERNKKKRAKLQNNLMEWQKRISNEKYRKKTKPHKKEADLVQIKAIEAQIKELTELIIE